MEKSPLLIILLGYPGSGKSYFSQKLSEKIGAVRINGDALRIALAGSIKKVRDMQTHHLNQFEGYINNSFLYDIRQVLRVGDSVICDMDNHKKSGRRAFEKIAKEFGVTPVIVWIRTPWSVALKRTKTRKPADDSRRFSIKEAPRLMQEHMVHFDEPTFRENKIEIDGTVTFDEQFRDFEKQLKQIISKSR